MYKNELEIDVFRCLKGLVKKIRYIALITVIFYIIGVGMTFDVGENKYTSTATVYAAAEQNYNEAANAVTAMNAYLDVATSYKVSQRASLIMGRSDIDASYIKSVLMVGSSLKNNNKTSSVSSFMNSSATIISFYATTPDPELSREIADAAAESYVIEMGNILKYDSVKLLDSASTGSLTYEALFQALLTRIKFAAVGLAVAILLILFFEIFDNKVRTVREASIRSQLPVIGIIPDYKE